MGFLSHVPVVVQTAFLLVLSNCFMSWSIALFEYLLQVPANRIGYGELSLAQLKILQEVITLTVFIPFSLFFMKESFKWDYVWAGLCMVGAVYFMFRSHGV